MPKAVMLSYDNMIFNATSLSADSIASLPADVSIQPEEMRIVSYLPLSHIAGMIFDIINHVLYGCNLYFAKPDALQGTLVETLQWARPTTFLAVPRVWEKFEEKLKQAASEKPEIL
jgi:long-chain-fatty-acid--CoA ligase ACSBG